MPEISNEEPVDPIAARQGARLRLLLEEKQEEEGRRISYEEVAEAVGTTAGAFGHYARGRVRIPYELLEPLSRYFSASILYLLGLSVERGVPGAGLSDSAHLVGDLVNQMSAPSQRLMVAWAMDQLKTDRQRREQTIGA